MRRDSMIGQSVGFAVAAALLFSIGGCTSDDDGNPAHWPAVGDVPEPFDYRTIPEPWAEGDVAACKAYLAFDEATTTAAAAALTRRECLCDAGDACLEMLRQCDALEGCTQIRMCGIEKNCNSPNTCYLFPAAPCVTTIDRWGNGSVSAGLSTNMQADCGCP